MTRDDRPRQERNGARERGFASVVGLDEDGPGKLAVAYPELSRLEVHTGPDEERIIECVALAFREELMHGARQQFGLGRTLSLLERRAVDSLYAHFRGVRSLSATVDRIDATVRVAQTLYESAEEIVEAIDKYLTQFVLQNNISDILPGFELSEGRAARIEKRLRGRRKRIDENWKNHDVYGELDRLRENYGRQAMRTVADATLDLPFAVDPVAVPNVPTRPVGDVDLRDRFYRAVTLIRQGTDPPALREALTGNSDRSTANLASVVHLPLLDVPSAVSTDATGRKRMFEEMKAAPSPIAYVIRGAFQMTGAFGGAFYRLEAGDSDWDWSDDGEFGWMVNPFIADVSVSARQADTYAELWERRQVGSGLLDQLWPDDRDGRLGAADSIVCPLCSRSPRTRACGTGGCAYEPYVKRAQALREPFQATLLS